MFENFDYKKAAKGGGKLITGIVKTVSPGSGAGIDEAGGGLGEVLKAAGVDLSDGTEAEEPRPTTPPPQKKTAAQRFDAFELAPTPKPPKYDGKRWQEVQTFQNPDGSTTQLETVMESEKSDRDITAELLKQRGWSVAEVSKIMAGPSVEAARVKEATAERVDVAASRTDEKTGISNAAAPAKRVPTVRAKRIQ